MKTKQIRKSTTRAKRPRKTKTVKKAVTSELSQATKEALENGVHKTIDVSLIDDNPKNRKYYKQKDLEGFAEVLKRQGQIHEIVVVETEGNRYKLIVGHRRTKSSRIAGLPTIRANIVKLTEAQEKEIMFSENAHRENPHPLDDAALIASMQEDQMTMEEIALHLVKPLSFVYNRIKLNVLIEPFKEMFIEERMTLKAALQLAALSTDSQEQFFNSECIGWREVEPYTLDDLEDDLSNYLYDLTTAPFDTKAKNLVKGVGACTKCPHNSATVSVLFPELADQAICSHKSCYDDKCTAFYHLQMAAALLNEKPEAVIFTSPFGDDLRAIIKSYPATADLPTVDYYCTNKIFAPEPPKKETYSELNDKGKVKHFDKEGYEQALKEYEADQQEFELMIHKGEVQKGLFVGHKEIALHYFRTTGKAKSTVPQQTKKQVDEAIKNNTATTKLLEDEIIRMNEKKKRAGERMREKIQMEVHKAVTDFLKTPMTFQQLVDADIIATRVIIYEGLDGNAQEEVNKAFGIVRDTSYEKRYDILSQLSEQQTAYLIRKALQSKSDSKYPKNLAGYCLYKCADSWGVNTKEIEVKQAKITREEIKETDKRIEDMTARLETMKIKAA